MFTASSKLASVLRLAIALTVTAAATTGLLAQPRWKSVPDAPSLPPPATAGYVENAGARLWYATFGDYEKPPVLLIHGGAGSSDHWGAIVRNLSADYNVIVFDTRGHGRSANNVKRLAYDQMAQDAVVILTHLNVQRTSIIGWSDGANIGFYLAKNFPERIRTLIAFAGNATPAGYQRNTNPDTLAAYMAKTNREYRLLSPKPERREEVLTALANLWKTQPSLTAKDLASIKTKSFIFHAEHDELIRRDHAEWIAKQIPNATFVILPGVSHFAIFQDPDGFIKALRNALADQ